MLYGGKMCVPRIAPESFVYVSDSMCTCSHPSPPQHVLPAYNTVFPVARLANYSPALRKPSETRKLAKMRPSRMLTNYPKLQFSNRTTPFCALVIVTMSGVRVAGDPLRSFRVFQHAGSSHSQCIKEARDWERASIVRS